MSMKEIVQIVREFSPLANPRAASTHSLVRGLMMCPVIVLLFVGCGKKQVAALPPPVVQIAEVTSGNAPMDTEIIGQLDSPQNVEVRARVEAFVEKVLFTEGTPVKEGDPLYLLDKKPFLERLAAANGMLAEARAALKK